MAVGVLLEDDVTLLQEFLLFAGEQQWLEGIVKGLSEVVDLLQWGAIGGDVLVHDLGML